MELAGLLVDLELDHLKSSGSRYKSARGMFEPRQNVSLRNPEVLESAGFLHSHGPSFTTNLATLADQVPVQEERESGFSTPDLGLLTRAC